MVQVVVLGAGIVGSVIAADLAEDGWQVTVADADEGALARARDRSAGRARALRRDLAQPAAVAALAAEADLVVGALPGRLGLAALEAVARVGRDCCDISFMPEDPRVLDALARERGVRVVVDCGVAPGLSHLLCARAAAELRPCASLEILVGGLPASPQPPFGYKAAFSPEDVIEEYVRPARYVRGGEVRTAQALSAREMVDLPGMPPLEAFLTDGLRSLLDTLDVPDVTEKTLRYPGHAHLMEAFRSAGLFSTEPVRVGDVWVRPRDATQAVLFPAWSYEPGEEDLTVLRVRARGVRDGRPATLTWDLLDRADAQRGFSSMARTTAFPCTLVARELAAGRVRDAGVHVPESLGGDRALVDRVLAGLAARGVTVRVS